VADSLEEVNAATDGRRVSSDVHPVEHERAGPQIDRSSEIRKLPGAPTPFPPVRVIPVSVSVAPEKL
jgi:hypothetical protein